MKGYAWTVFQGAEPEPVPVEIIGLWKNVWGPKQDIILAKLGGKARETNVAGGMSGSPVYVDGKLVGAISLRMSVFSPDAVCGITPIELMLEISDFDLSQPSDAVTPERAWAPQRLELPSELLAQVVQAGAVPPLTLETPALVPIETPLVFSGFHDSVLREFGPLFRQLGIAAVQGGAAGTLGEPSPAPGWQNALHPGDAVAGVLVSGDMSVTGLGTVTYNDGRRILAFGHPLFNLGPVAMPMSKAEVLMVLSSSFQPTKFANATEIVGALKQDRRSGILGILGAKAEMIPVSVTVRSLTETHSVLKERRFRYHVFVHQKWTPTLMMLTLFNSVAGVNDFGEESTFRLSGEVELEGGASVRLTTMQAPSELPVPAPMLLAGWVGDRFNRLFLNAVKAPRLKRVEVAVDLLPQRRVATIENAWAEQAEVKPGDEVPLKVFLRPYRGERLERRFTLRIPPGLPKGDYQILLSDAETLNRLESAAGRANRFLDLEQTVSLLNRERANNHLYVSLVKSSPTLYFDDKTLPSLPASVWNVLQTGRAATRPLAASRETVDQQAALPFDFVISGSYSLRIKVN
ncbi:MAG: hypothetical protein RMK57_04635 [Bryobacterales bacterium]|nr:hypothetical protein [Bryobacteraceae bacterium]MDW8353798.1 hypothetical protein [Bryobacterales bacterium]